MGAIITLECSACKLKSEQLFILEGFSGTEYAVAWCKHCRQFTTVPVAQHPPNPSKKPTLIDDRSIAIPPYLDAPGSRKHRCLRCYREVTLYDMEKKVCPLCGSPVKENPLGIWD